MMLRSLYHPRRKTMTDCIWLDLLGVFAITLGIATMLLWRWV
jgi:hypothetical protein